METPQQPEEDSRPRPSGEVVRRVTEALQLLAFQPTSEVQAARSSLLEWLSAKSAAHELSVTDKDILDMAIEDLERQLFFRANRG
jgi:hypothetical protein